MCKCTPENTHLPYCGRPGCRWPEHWVESMSKQRDPGYPEVVYLREPDRDDLHAGEVVQIDVATHYARRGSHWVKYVLADGEQLGEAAGDLAYAPKEHFIEKATVAGSYWMDRG